MGGEKSAEFETETIPLTDGSLAYAMVHVKDKVFELSKMAVDINYQGLGIGRKLINRCIDFAKNKGTKEVFLITNDKLAPALELYKSSGFELDEDYDDNRYKRGNTKMKLLL